MRPLPDQQQGGYISFRCAAPPPGSLLLAEYFCSLGTKCQQYRGVELGCGQPLANVLDIPLALNFCEPSLYFITNGKVPPPTLSVTG
jgi:hypothetical protein